jgi:hypothetical protein
MKYVEAGPGFAPRLELTRRNLEVLLAKLDDPLSERTLLDPDGVIYVTAVENDANGIYVTAVENDAHYSDRAPGPMYMPSTGETI